MSRVRGGVEVEPIEQLPLEHYSHPPGGFINLITATAQSKTFVQLLNGFGFTKIKLKNWLQNNGVSLTQNAFAWIKSLPDYEKWKRRFEDYASGAPPQASNLPTGMSMDDSEVGNSW